jgi:hypothetical protein
MPNRLSKLASSFEDKSTNLGISDSLANLFSSSEKPRKRRPGKPSTSSKSPEKINRGIPLWRSDKAKKEAQRLFAKGLITKQEARKRVVRAEADFQVFMQRIKSMDFDGETAKLKVPKGEVSDGER